MTTPEVSVTVAATPAAPAPPPPLPVPPWKRKCLDFAEVFDSWRIVPRIVLFSFLGIDYWLVINSWLWYQHLLPVDRTMSVAAYSGGLTTALGGLAALVYKIYSGGGRDWNNPGPISPVPNYRTGGAPEVSDPY